MCDETPIKSAHACFPPTHSYTITSAKQYVLYKTKQDSAEQYMINFYGIE